MGGDDSGVPSIAAVAYRVVWAESARDFLAGNRTVAIVPSAISAFGGLDFGTLPTPRLTFGAFDCRPDLLPELDSDLYVDITTLASDGSYLPPGVPVLVSSSPTPISHMILAGVAFGFLLGVLIGFGTVVGKRGRILDAWSIPQISFSIGLVGLAGVLYLHSTRADEDLLGMLSVVVGFGTGFAAGIGVQLWRLRRVSPLPRAKVTDDSPRRLPRSVVVFILLVALAALGWGVRLDRTVVVPIQPDLSTAIEFEPGASPTPLKRGHNSEASALPGEFLHE